MPDDPLLTLCQVADELGLPESTVRYYRDAFLDQVPFVGMGRRRRYPPPAVAVLRAIAEGYAAGRTRAQILFALDGTVPAPADAAATAGRTPRAGPRPREEVSNLELLAAIVNGEREQRDALWEMAREIVRLASVLEGQERMLAAIADGAGVSLAGQPALGALPGPARALGEGGPAPEGPGGDGRNAVPLFGSRPLPLEDAAGQAPAAHRPVPAPPDAGGAAGAAPDLERLRAELEEERQLVERLREAKVKLEHRVTDAEAELEERRRKRSVLGRILRTGEPE